jgi:hypothetical protein
MLEDKDSEAADKFKENKDTTTEDHNFDAATAGSAREAKRTLPLSRTVVREICLTLAQAKSANNETSVQALYLMVHMPKLQGTEVRSMK